MLAHGRKQGATLGESCGIRRRSLSVRLLRAGTPWEVDPAGLVAIKARGCRRSLTKHPAWSRASLQSCSLRPRGDATAISSSFAGGMVLVVVSQGRAWIGHRITFIEVQLSIK